MEPAMYDVFFAVAANRILVDAKTQQISIIDLYEKLQASGFPVVIPKLSLLFYVSRGQDDPVTCSPMLTCSCADETILSTVLSVDFKESDVARVVVALDNFSLPKPGSFKANLRLDDQDWGQLELDVAISGTDPHPHVVKSGKFSYRVS
jgi:hypothetical protein